MAEIYMTVTSKGQVTIPAAVRRHLKIRKHQKIALVLEPDGSVRLKSPRYGTVADLRGAAGKLGSALSWAEMLTIAYADRTLPADSSRPARK
jgi:AbrB family looped-hinge helix DNA binding protein